MTFTREQIRADFREKVARKEPLIAASAGCGLVAKMLDLGGADLIMAYNTGVFRMDGAHGSCGLLPYGNGTSMSFDLGRRVRRVVKNNPLIGGIGAAEPYWDIDMCIDEMMEKGFSGITNVPCAASEDETINEWRNAAGLGFDAEVELIRKCNQKNVFSVAYAFTVEQIRRITAAGADVVSAHCGLTAGGLLGSKNVMDIDRACEITQKVYEAAKEENPDVFVFCHGGPFWNPENVQYCFDHTDVDGFIGASCVERIPIEEAIFNVVTDFKKLKLSQ